MFFFKVASSLNPAFCRAFCDPVLSENVSAYTLTISKSLKAYDVAALIALVAMPFPQKSSEIKNPIQGFSCRHLF